MPKLKDFAEAKRKFKTDEDAVQYFFLVELYEKHLTGKQKEDFLNADTIDGMLDILDEKQLRYLKSLLVASKKNDALADTDDKTDQFYKEAYSEWIIKTGILDKSWWAPVDKLITKTSKKAQKKTDMKDLFLKYKQRCKKFAHASEYNQWLILMYVDNKIPFIDRLYDVSKLLKHMDLESLKVLNKRIQELNIPDIIQHMKYLEPYYYQIALRGINYETAPEHPLGTHESDFIKKNTKSPIYLAFKESKDTLLKLIEKTISDNTEFVEEKIDGLTTSKSFDDNVLEVAKCLGGTDEILLKDAIAQYSKPGPSGEVYNGFLRKAVFLRNLSEGSSSVGKLMNFRNNIGKVAEYFENHLTSEKYTVYRGMRLDGLKALLDNSTPKINYETDPSCCLKVDENLINQINKERPIVFDEGLTSTSLNKGVSAVSFHGKQDGNVFLTITIPPKSKALVLDYEGIENVPREEEVLLAKKTKMRLNNITKVNKHYEINAIVVNEPAQ